MPAGSTYDKIASTTLSTSTATVTFSSIPGTYTDLRLIVSAQGASSNFYMKPNSDGNSRYSTTFMQGDGSSADSSRFVRTDLGGNGMLVARSATFPTTTNTYGMCIIDIMNYSNTTTLKTVLSRWGVATAVSGASINLYNSTSAITQLDCTPFANSWTAGSTFNLYGIAAA
jgi:hypothetical protein